MNEESLESTEVVQADDSALTCQVFREGKPSHRSHQLHEVSEILSEEGTLVWFDLVDPGPEDLALLELEFDLHPLAVEDAVMAHQRPKIEAYDSFYFVVVQGATLLRGTDLVLHEVAIFAGQKFLVTVRHAPVFPLDEIQARWSAHPERLRRGGGFLLYTILDTVVDGYFPIVDSLSDRVDELEQTLFEDRPLGTEVVREIFTMKQDGTTFRRAALPMRDILTPIMRGDLTLFPPEEVVYFRDVYDHSIRVTDQLDTLRDLTSSALDIHLSIVANRHNSVSKQLTLIATIFLPLSFLVGFFGQNFDFLVTHITGKGAFFVAGIGSEIVALVILLLYFRRRDWF